MSGADLHTKAAVLHEAGHLLGTMTKAPILKTLLAYEICRTLGIESTPEDAAEVERREQKHEPRGPRLPAYARPILDLRKRGMAPARSIHLIAASRQPFEGEWKWGKGLPRAVVPCDIEPAMIDFVFLAGLDVELYWSSLRTAFKRVEAIIRAVMRHSPTSLWVMDMEETDMKDDPHKSFYVVSRRNGVELPEYAA